MKILFISSTGAEYLGDTLFHGLRSLLGADVVDWPKRDRFYKGGRTPEYGRGFTVWNNLDDIEVDRADVLRRVRCKEFDFVVFTFDHFKDVPAEKEIVQLYMATAPQQRVMVDGDDMQSILAFKGIYFKRENVGNALPISFSIPKEKCVVTVPGKTCFEAKYKPGMAYMYETEAEYYEGYREARWAITNKRAGWDCMRHYEIMSQGCFPDFIGIEKCPEMTCTSLPKQFIQDRPVADEGDCEIILGHCRRFCTTEAEASRFLSCLRGFKI